MTYAYSMMIHDDPNFQILIPSMVESRKLYGNKESTPK